MNEQKKQVLQMLAEGKITADEAERLLDTLDRGESPKAESAAPETRDDKKPKYLHIKVEGQSEHHDGHENVDIKIPILLLKAGIKLGTLMPESARSRLHSHFAEKGLNVDLNHIDPEHIDVIVEALKESTIDIDSDRKKVHIYCA